MARSSWVLFVLAAVAAVAGSWWGARRTLEAAYDVTVERPTTATASLTVALTLRHVPGDSLTLVGLAGLDVLSIADLTIEDGDGRPLAARRADRPMEADAHGPLVQPRWIVARPPRDRIRIRYRATVGARQGNDHVGFSGHAAGLVVPDAIAFTGRSVFLVPDPERSPARVEVRFVRPQEWDVVAPWRRQNAAWRPGVRGGDELEHLASAMVGVGRFRRHRVTDFGTAWTFAVPAAVPVTDDHVALRQLSQATRFVAGVFRRGLGPQYTTLVLPKTPIGDEVSGEGWATGQGGTLLPLTRVRLRTFAEQLVDAYALHGPYRSSFSDPRDFWVPAGLRRYLGTRAMASAGLLPAEDVAPSLAVRLVTAPGSAAGPLRLERDYPTPNEPVPGGDAAAAAMLYDVDRIVARASSGRHTVDDAVAAMFRSARARSLWDVLPELAPYDWSRYRADYVAAGRFAPLETFPGLAFAAPTPTPASGSPVRTVRLICTGNTGAFLENCGCKSNQSGGAARRQTVLDRLRRDRVPTLLLDAGNALPPPGPFQPQDDWSRAEVALALRLMRDQGYAAIAVSTHELTWGRAFFAEIQRASGAPFVSAVVDRAGTPLAPRCRVVPFGGHQLAVVSAFEPPTYVDAQGAYENHASEFSTGDPLAAAERAVRDARSRADAVCVIGRMTPRFVRRLVAACPEIDVVISNEPYALVTGTDSTGRPRASETDVPGFLGTCLVLYTDLGQYGVTVADLGLSATGAIATARVRSEELSESIPDDPRVRSRLTAFYERVGRGHGGAAAVYRPLASDSLRQHGRYVGARTCQVCHAEEYVQWRQTPHASAYKTLLDAHRNHQPRCVACHVVAYGAAHGYAFGDPSPRLTNVQCEVCHGPGGDHMRDPAGAPMRPGADRDVCLSCHTPDHSDHFVFEDRLPSVLHRSTSAGAAMAARHDGRGP